MKVKKLNKETNSYLELWLLEYPEVATEFITGLTKPKVDLSRLSDLKYFEEEEEK